jgi:flagellar basal body-associated protein FliL
MDWHFLSGKNKLVIRYLLIVLVFVLLAVAVFVYFKFRIKMIEKENEPGFPTEQQK